MASVNGRAFQALIRTHHITSRKKIHRLRHAASVQQVYALIRCGGAPGIMYCEGEQKGVEEWVAVLQRLRYKDFELVKKPAEFEPASTLSSETKALTGLHEVNTVREFGMKMDARGLLHWWRKGMGYAENQDRL